MIVGIFEAPLICSCAGNLQSLNKLFKALRVVSIHLVTPLISGTTPGSSTLLSSVNQKVLPVLPSARSRTCKKCQNMWSLRRMQGQVSDEDHETLYERSTLGGNRSMRYKSMPPYKSKDKGHVGQPRCLIWTLALNWSLTYGKSGRFGNKGLFCTLSRWAEYSKPSNMAPEQPFDLLLQFCKNY